MTAASLAKRGYSSRSNILEAAQGFGATQSDSVSVERFERDIEAVDSFVPDTNFKYHAAGYLVHSAIEAAKAHCGTALGVLFGSENGARMVARHKFFSGLRPADLIQEGRIEEVLEAIQSMSNPS